MINESVAILNADFISNPGPIYLEFHNPPPWYNFTGEPGVSNLVLLDHIFSKEYSEKGANSFWSIVA